MPLGQTQTPNYDNRVTGAQNAYQNAYNSALPGVVGNLNSGNFGGAFNAASGLPTSYGVTNTMLQQLASSSGLNQLDPSLQWNPQSINSYYKAAFQPNTWGSLTGVPNPYTSQYTAWGQGGPGQAASDASANIAGGGAPDIGRYGGYNVTNDSSPFWNLQGAALKYAPSIMLALAAPEALPAISSAMGGVGGSALAGGLYGAGGGAFSALANGTDPLKGALVGGVTGGIGASGAVQGVAGGANAYLTDVAG